MELWVHYSWEPARLLNFCRLSLLSIIRLVPAFAAGALLGLRPLQTCRTVLAVALLVEQMAVSEMNSVLAFFLMGLCAVPSKAGSKAGTSEAKLDLQQRPQNMPK